LGEAEDGEVPAWAAETEYAEGDRVHPVTPNGYYYRCTVAGTSSTGEPTWPTTPELTVTDGGVTWRCERVRDGTTPLLKFPVCDWNLDFNNAGYLDTTIPGYSGGASIQHTLEVAYESLGANRIASYARLWFYSYFIGGLAGSETLKVQCKHAEDASWAFVFIPAASPSLAAVTPRQAWNWLTVERSSP
jgi:hypothetical protein